MRSPVTGKRSNAIRVYLNDITSILRFIEYNWSLGTIGDPQSFDVLAGGSILGMFDFDDFVIPALRRLVLNPSTGQPMGFF